MIRITHLLRMCFSNLMSCQSQPHRARSSQSLAQVWGGGGVVTGGFAVGADSSAEELLASILLNLYDVTLELLSFHPGLWLPRLLWPWGSWSQQG